MNRQAEVWQMKKIKGRGPVRDHNGKKQEIYDKQGIYAGKGRVYDSQSRS